MYPKEDRIPFLTAKTKAKDNYRSNYKKIEAKKKKKGKDFGGRD